MEAAQMKIGFRLALGQAGWHAPPEQEAIYYRRLAWHMATCAFDPIHTHGLAALCRLMYSQEGSPKCTREDGGAVVEYRAVASKLWERIKRYEPECGKVGSRQGAIAGHPMSVCKLAWMEAWNDIVYAMPLLDSCPFWRGETKYPTPAVEKMYVTGYGDYPWTECSTFGHRQQVQHRHSQVIWLHLRAAGTHYCRPTGRVRKHRGPQDPGLVDRECRCQLVAQVRPASPQR